MKVPKSRIEPIAECWNEAVEMERFPGVEIVREGIEDLRRGVTTVAALLVSIGAPRLRQIGLPVPEQVIRSPEIELYLHLAQSDPDGAHSKYNALIRRLVSFERAAERAKSSRARED